MRSELETVGVDRFDWSRSPNRSRQSFADNAPAGFAGYHPSADDDFDRMVIHLPGNIETQEEKGGGSA